MKAAKSTVPRVLLAGTESIEIRQGLCQYARKAGWLVVVGEAPNAPPKEEAAFWDVAGIVVQRHHGSAEPWKQGPIPIVRLDDSLSGGVVVAVDHGAIGQMAARHLLEARFAHLAYCSPGDMVWAQRQRDAFEQETRRAGAEFYRLDWINSRPAQRGYSSQRFRQWLADEIAALPTPLGLLLDSDWTAVEAYEACIAAGLAVPEQVALVGIGDNAEICESLPVPLSSVRVNGCKVGYRAAELLDEMISNRPVPQGNTLIAPGGITVRQSSNIIAIADLPTARGLRYIWQHLAEKNLSSEEVAAAVGLSRRAMDLHFMEHLHRPVAQEISAARLVQAIILLSNTDKTLEQVARETGFTSARHLRYTFNRTRGRPIQQWRKETRARARAQQEAQAVIPEPPTPL
ncbi:MAG: substrate-binding domain-containing protein [Planctomycetaceae bacterium]|nr:substrate-binding domain-containing protein [Planctomycetaceae bacterium]